MLSCFSLSTVRALAALRSAAFFAAADMPAFLDPADDADVMLSVSVSMTLMSSSERSQGAGRIENERLVIR